MYFMYQCDSLRPRLIGGTVGLGLHTIRCFLAVEISDASGAGPRLLMVSPTSGEQGFRIFILLAFQKYCAEALEVNCGVGLVWCGRYRRRGFSYALGRFRNHAACRKGTSKGKVCKTSCSGNAGISDSRNNRDSPDPMASGASRHRLESESITVNHVMVTWR
jgi:hypothetical protein